MATNHNFSFDACKVSTNHQAPNPERNFLEYHLKHPKAPSTKPQFCTRSPSINSSFVFFNRRFAGGFVSISFPAVFGISLEFHFELTDSNWRGGSNRRGNYRIIPHRILATFDRSGHWRDCLALNDKRVSFWVW
ncbi:hypothetical protein CDAR_7861 [Caerostris darwini]|uniref:Uncharacterized protein n=1 Tax=Caerostris darwini TaxID=1538125 RepID=A0AAV4QCW6_9ARAC|nr:hypothetical protein CDAR_7861 [Caerostris darwini]